VSSRPLPGSVAGRASWKQNWPRPPPSERLLARLRLAPRRRGLALGRRSDRRVLRHREHECDSASRTSGALPATGPKRRWSTQGLLSTEKYGRAASSTRLARLRLLGHADVVAASCNRGRCGSRDRAEQRPLGGVPGGRTSSKSATPTTRADPASARQWHDWRSRSPARSSRHPASRAVSRPGRPSACRGSHFWPRRDWTCMDAASGWPEASTVGYGSARGATAAHRGSDG
jgi:hypothetical protein